jgi:hypothetical protein
VQALEGTARPAKWPYRRLALLPSPTPRTGEQQHEHDLDDETGERTHERPVSVLVETPQECVFRVVAGGFCDLIPHERTQEDGSTEDSENGEHPKKKRSARRARR